MPKKDGFGDQKKDAEKARKKLNETNKKEAKLAKDEAREEEVVVRGPTSAATGSTDRHGAKASTGTFAVAAAAGAGEEDEGAEDYDYDVAETEATTASSSAKAKKEPKKASKSSQKKDEFALLAEQQGLAKKERIKDRFFKVLIVGVIMDMWKGDGNGNSNGNHGSEKNGKKAPVSGAKKTKASQREVESSFTVGAIKEKIDVLSGPIMVLVFVAAVLYGKSMEDAWSPGFDSSVDFYDVMGVPHDASVMDIRKKYKSLSLTWHPDKNPDCEACPEKFAAISKAYETLKDPDQKKAYDSKTKSRESLSSMASVDLSAEDFEAKVLRSNEVWYVEIYDPADGTSSSFHPIWEEIANSYQQVARFGRVDKSKHKRIDAHLPQRVVITPVVFRFARDEYPEMWHWQGNSEESGSAPLSRFVVENYPALHKMENKDDVTAWWKGSHRSRLLITGNAAVIRRGAQNKDFFKVLREAHMWSPYFSIGSCDGKDAVEALKAYGVTFPEPDRKKGHPWSVVYIPAGETNAKVLVQSTDDVKEFPAKIEDVVQKAMSAEAPHLTVRNHRQLCGAGTASRTFCLILVDHTDTTQITKVIGEIAGSRTDYAKELAETREAESDDAVEEEPFRIQAVRVMTGTSRFPSQPVAVSRDFYTAWAEVGHAPMFLVELETQRVSAVKESALANLYQQIAYEDIKLKELPEDFHLVLALPDPEVPFTRALLKFVTSPFGGLLTYVLVAAALAVAPEFALVTNAAAGGGFLAVMTLVWPMACRKFLGTLMFM